MFPLSSFRHFQPYQLILCTGCFLTLWHNLYSWNDTSYWFFNQITMLSTYVVCKKIFPWINPAIYIYFFKFYFQIPINLLPRWHLFESLAQKKEIALLLVLQMVRLFSGTSDFFCSNNNKLLLRGCIKLLLKILIMYINLLSFDFFLPRRACYWNFEFKMARA